MIPDRHCDLVDFLPAERPSPSEYADLGPVPGPPCGGPCSPEGCFSPRCPVGQEDEAA